VASGQWPVVSALDSMLATDHRPLTTSRIHVRTAMCVVGTTDCRIFSCQRSIGGGPCTPPGALTRGAPKPHSVRALNCQTPHAVARGDPEGPAPRRALISARLRPSGCGGTAFALSDAGRRLVENTGLEPVTSWLQTRRSPS
jgi:hypothetical protein